MKTEHRVYGLREFNVTPELKEIVHLLTNFREHCSYFSLTVSYTFVKKVHDVS